RIIGGRKVKPHSRPYMAYLKIETDSGNSSCGGFLIRPDAVLSAAHCVGVSCRTVKVSVILGAHNVSKQERSQQKFSVRRRVIHPNYTRDGFRNDIVLLKLKAKAKTNKNVKVISFPRSNAHLREGAKCRVPGWGWTSLKKDRTDVMREVELKVQNEEICQYQFNYFQYQSMICVGDDHNKKASYFGDSGGPLVCKKKAYGIVSHGLKGRLFPEVFTRISYFEPWIREQLRR
ncbi:CATG protein, partial [Regulus satrapa]|nr:CATG protein [Regulus satrapa]